MAWAHLSCRPCAGDRQSCLAEHDTSVAGPDWRQRHPQVRWGLGALVLGGNRGLKGKGQAAQGPHPLPGATARALWVGLGVGGTRTLRPVC